MNSQTKAILIAFAIAAVLGFGLLSLLILQGVSTAFEHTHCEDSAVKSILSPDGKQVVVIYNRSCSFGSGLYTWANLEHPSIWFSGNRRQSGCHLLTLARGYHPLDASWKDATHIELSSTDKLYSEDVSFQTFPCKNITLSYNFKYKLR